MSICKCGHTFGYHDHGWRQERCRMRTCECRKFRRSWLKSWAPKL